MPKIALGVTAIASSSYLLYRYTRTVEAVHEPEKEVPIVKSALSRTKTKVLKAKFSDYHKKEKMLRMIKSVSTKLQGKKGGKAGNQQ